MTEPYEILKAIAIDLNSTAHKGLRSIITDCLPIILSIIAITAAGVPWFSFYDAFSLMIAALVCGSLAIGFESHQDISAFLHGLVKR